MAVVVLLGGLFVKLQHWRGVWGSFGLGGAPNMGVGIKGYWSIHRNSIVPAEACKRAFMQPFVTPIISSGLEWRHTFAPSWSHDFYQINEGLGPGLRRDDGLEVAAGDSTARFGGDCLWCVAHSVTTHIRSFDGNLIRVIELGVTSSSARPSPRPYNAS